MLKYAELRSAPRTDLGKAVPLPRPFTVFIEPTNVCNFRCDMCPESFPDYRERAGYYKRMPAPLYEKILADLKELGPIKALKFYFEGEPLLNPELPEMIRMAREMGVANRLELTTNASLITESVARRLVGAGLDYVRISIYALEDVAYQEVTASKYTAALVKDNLRRFREIRDATGATKPILYAQWLEQDAEADARFLSEYSKIVDETGIEPRHNWNGSDDRLVQIGGAGKHPKQACPEPFYTLAIKANGDVSACCIDWSGKLVIGNAATSSVKDLWEGEELRRIQEAHIAKRRDELPGCRGCTLIYNFPDNIDHLTPEEFAGRFPVRPERELPHT
jgi:radical SAM protein with 4Fe4S-binding SPASM domain